MNCLYARANSKFHLVLSDRNCPNLFESVVIDDNLKSTPYAYPSSLESDEWFSYSLATTDDIEENGEDDEKISDPLERLNRQIKTSLPTLAEEQYKSVKYIIFQPKDSEWFYLQKVPLKSKIYGKKLLTFSEQPKVVNTPFIIIHEEPDALYNTRTNTLYFKNINRINDIFNNINILYREASKPEMQTFLDLSLISIQDGFNVGKISLINSKHIAIVLNEYNSHSDDIKEELHSYMENLPDLPRDENGKYVIKNDTDLRTFIYALQERYYTTIATKKNRLAKSFIQK